MPCIAGIDAIIFDFDGVLVDVRTSIMLVHAKAAELYFKLQGWTDCGALITQSDVESFKLAGGFNNDWDLAYAWELLYLYKHVHTGSSNCRELRNTKPSIDDYTSEASALGGGLKCAESVIRRLCTQDEWQMIESMLDRQGLLRVFKETYAGDLCPEIYGFEPEIVKGPGLICNDKKILDESLIPDGLKLGIATGRTAGEVHAGIRLMGWSHLLDVNNVISEGDGFLKPDPRILELAASRLEVRRPVYAGDTPDDLLTVANYNSVNDEKFISCMVTTGLKNPGLVDIFKENKADIIADNINAALVVINRCIGGTLCLTAM
ncbi:MAG: HAD family hydrolase [Armatimonadota bacterium]